MKRVTRLFIGESYLAGTHPATGGAAASGWAEGALTLLKEDLTELVTADISGGYDGPVYVARYDRVSGLALSFPIYKKSISSYKYKAYSAPVKKVLTVTMPTTPVIGDEYGLFITDTTEREILRNGRRLFSEIAETATKGDLTDLLVAYINSDPNVSVVASKDGSDNLALTAKEFGSFFEIGLTYELYGQTITTTAAGSFGCGSYALVKALEEDVDLGYQGHLNRVMYPDVPEKYAKSTSTYGMFVIEHSSSQEDGMIGTTGYKSPVATVIALNSTADTNGGTAGTDISLFKTLLEGWLDIAPDEL